jgi:hypothetical protein
MISARVAGPDLNPLIVFDGGRPRRGCAIVRRPGDLKPGRERSLLSSLNTTAATGYTNGRLVLFKEERHETGESLLCTRSRRARHDSGDRARCRRSASSRLSGPAAGPFAPARNSAELVIEPERGQAARAVCDERTLAARRFRNRAFA